MSLKEHLQVLAMMIPTLILLFAAACSLAWPATSLGGAVSAPQVVQVAATMADPQEVRRPD